MAAVRMSACSTTTEGYMAHTRPMPIDSVAVHAPSSTRFRGCDCRYMYSGHRPARVQRVSWKRVAARGAAQRTDERQHERKNADRRVRPHKAAHGGVKHHGGRDAGGHHHLRAQDAVHLAAAASRRRASARRRRAARASEFKARGGAAAAAARTRFTPARAACSSAGAARTHARWCGAHSAAAEGSSVAHAAAPFG